MWMKIKSLPIRDFRMNYFILFFNLCNKLTLNFSILIYSNINYKINMITSNLFIMIMAYFLSFLLS